MKKQLSIFVTMLFLSFMVQSLMISINVTGNTPPMADAGGPYIAGEGSPVYFNASGSYDPEGDTLEYRWDWENDGIFDTAWLFFPTAFHTWHDEHVGSIMLQVREIGTPEQFTSKNITSIIVNNVAPMVETGSNITIYEGQTADFYGTFFDPGGFDTFTYIWDMGEGTSFTGNILSTGNLLANDDFSLGLVGWNVTVEDPLTTVKILPIDMDHENVLDINNPNDDWDGDWDWVYQELNLNVSGLGSLFFEADGKAIYQSLSDDGWVGGEYPVHFSISYQDVTGVWHIGQWNNNPWQQGFYYEGTGEYFYSHKVPQNIWFHYKSGNLMNLNPKPNIIGKVKVGASGWAYHGMIDNVKFYGYPPITAASPYGDDGLYTATLTVSDNDGGIGTNITYVTVENIAPTLTSVVAPIGGNTNELLTFSATATDPGSDDLSFAWNWGDGNPDNITTNYNDGFGPDPYPSPHGLYPFFGSSTVTHFYDNPGSYNITLTITDDDGGVTVKNITVAISGIPTILPPTLYVAVGQNGKNVTPYWDPPPTPGIDHYLIYRSTSQTDFDFSNIWANTSIDINPTTGIIDPLNTMWIDKNVINSSHPDYRDEYYYTIRAVNTAGTKSSTSNTAGYYVSQFGTGQNTFSLPLQPFTSLSLDVLMADMGAITISWLDEDNNWQTYPSISPQIAEVGKGYVVEFDSSTRYVFTGQPASMIIYQEGFGFDFATRDDIRAEVDTLGNVNVTWKPITDADKYLVYRSNRRDGFFRSSFIMFEVTTPQFQDLGVASSAGELYYLVVPYNSTLGNGSSTYSIGIWTEEFDGNEMFGLPLKPIWGDRSADWYVDQIPYCLGIVYLEDGIWKAHFKEFKEGVYDTIIELGRGYELTVFTTSRFTFIGW